VCVCVCGGVAGPAKWISSGNIYAFVFDPTRQCVQYASSSFVVYCQESENKQQNSNGTKKKLKIALSPSLLVGIFLFCRWKPNSRLCAYLCKQVRVIYAYRTVLPQPFNHSTAQPVIEITPRQNAWLPKLQLHVLVDSAEWLFSSVWICVLLRHKHYTNICKFWGSAGIELNASLLEQEFSSGIRKGNIPIKNKSVTVGV